MYPNLKAMSLPNLIWKININCKNSSADEESFPTHRKDKKNASDSRFDILQNQISFLTSIITQGVQPNFCAQTSSAPDSTFLSNPLPSKKVLDFGEMKTGVTKRSAYPQQVRNAWNY